MWILALILFIFLGSFAYAGMLAAPWFPTWSRDIERFLKLAEIKPGQKFYDLGCGDGKLVFAAAGAGAEAVGFEISLLPYLIAISRSFYVQNAKIIFKDFWKQNLSDADVVYIFLTPKVNPRAKEKLEHELKKGAKVIAYTWPIEGWQLTKTDLTPGQPPMYLYSMQ
ncbi:MAG: methionine biosynthesis protein MetW [bacterium]|nr:methionine biosynthesis protein MetW [bacterium]